MVLVDEGYEYTLRKTGSATTFYESSGALTDPVSCYISVPHGSWELQVAPAAGWKNDPVTVCCRQMFVFPFIYLFP
jgi:hypothetical protein